MNLNKSNGGFEIRDKTFGSNITLNIGVPIELMHSESEYIVSVYLRDHFDS